ncbi:MAG: hemolysin family protein [Candidatus Sumerlaeia bacterium]|nr:hemolysin family protein [Candidatus Sumerlaeia bacterium]
MTAILLVVGIASLVSFLCSLWEAALCSIPVSRIETMKERGVAGAALLSKLRAKIDEPISAILAFNTIAHTVGASVAGALVEQKYGGDSAWALAIFSALFTMHILVATEIIPKTVGVVFADRVAPASAPWIKALIFAVWPFVKLSEWITSGILKASAKQASGPTEADLLAMARIGAEQGTLSAAEAKWATNALLLDKVEVRELMTPRTVVYLLPENMPLNAVKLHASHWTHSRLPVCESSNPDAIVGVIYRREVFDQLLMKTREETEQVRLRDLMHAPAFVAESTTGDKLLERALKEREQFFVVVNEYGSMEGIITLEDLLEFLLGEEIVDPHDKHVDMREHARRVAAERRKRIERRPPGSTGQEAT